VLHLWPLPGVSIEDRVDREGVASVMVTFVSIESVRRLSGAVLLAFLAVRGGPAAPRCDVELEPRGLRGLEVLEVRRLAVGGDRGP
jgi:hypothetical protein